jgi:hypothetical protein
VFPAAVIKWLFKSGRETASGGTKILKAYYGKEVLSHTWVLKCFKRSRDGLEDHEDDPWSGLLSAT